MGKDRKENKQEDGDCSAERNSAGQKGKNNERLGDLYGYILQWMDNALKEL